MKHSLAKFTVGAAVGIVVHLAAIVVYTLPPPRNWGLVWTLVAGGFLGFAYGGWYLARRRGYPGILGAILAALSMVGLLLTAFLPNRTLRSRSEGEQLPAADPRLFPAIGRGDLGEVERLLDEGVDPDAAGKANQPALLYALEEAQGKIAELLVARGASATVRDRTGATALHVAAELGSSLMMEKLLDAGAEVDARSDDGWTALHCAAAWDARGVVSFLVERGADPRATDDDGRTPLQHAEEEGHSDCAALLRRLMRTGADPGDEGAAS